MKWLFSVPRETVNEHSMRCFQFEQSYIAYFSKLNARIVLLTSFDEISHPADFMPDMILLVGGGDISDNYYDNYTEVIAQPLRESIEISLLKYAELNNIPVLGICRGMQLINAFYGGRVTAGDGVIHEIGKYHSINLCLENRTLLVNSYHSDYVKKSTLSDKFLPLAIEDRLNSVEAFISFDSRVLGIQWHPERLNKHDDAYSYSLQIIKNFMERRCLA